MAPFVDARLVTAHEETIEIAHEALLAAWPRLRGWIDEGRETIVLRRRIGDATRVWLDHDRDSSALVSGARLATMQQAVDDESRAHLTQDERERANLARRHPERLADMRARYEAWNATMAPIPEDARAILVYTEADMPAR